MDACSLKAGSCRNATLDGANLDINQVGIHRPYDSLYQIKKRVSAGTPYRSQLVDQLKSGAQLDARLPNR